MMDMSSMVGVHHYAEVPQWTAMAGGHPVVVPIYVQTPSAVGPHHSSVNESAHGHSKSNLSHSRASHQRTEHRGRRDRDAFDPYATADSDQAQKRHRDELQNTQTSQIATLEAQLKTVLERLAASEAAREKLEKTLDTLRKDVRDEMSAAAQRVKAAEDKCAKLEGSIEKHQTVFALVQTLTADVRLVRTMADQHEGILAARQAAGTLPAPAAPSLAGGLKAGGFPTLKPSTSADSVTPSSDEAALAAPAAASPFKLGGGGGAPLNFAAKAPAAATTGDAAAPAVPAAGAPKNPFGKSAVGGTAPAALPSPFGSKSAAAPLGNPFSKASPTTAADAPAGGGDDAAAAPPAAAVGPKVTNPFGTPGTNPFSAGTAAATPAVGSAPKAPFGKASGNPFGNNPFGTSGAAAPLTNPFSSGAGNPFGSSVVGGSSPPAARKSILAPSRSTSSARQRAY